MEHSSAVLLHRLQGGDGESATIIWNRYVQRLTQLVRRRLGRGANPIMDADDAVASAFRSFFRRSQTADWQAQQPGDLWRLLATITRHKLSRQLRWQSAQRRSLPANLIHSIPMESLANRNAPSPLESLIALDLLEQWLMPLDPIDRQIVEARLQEMTWAEIAQTTGIPARTAQRRLARWIAVWEAAIRKSDTPQDSPATDSPNDSDNARREATSTHLVASAELREPLQLPAPQLESVSLERYRLVRCLGQGATGKVYAAYDQVTDEAVAVKLLRRPIWSDLAAMSRFQQEAELLTQLQHPSIIRLRAMGQLRSGGWFLVMPAYRTYPRQWSQRPRQQRLRDLVGVVDALAAAHQQGIVHCDLKWSNFLLDESDSPILSDFGFARHRRESSGMDGGTPGWMAPEQLDSRLGEISPATDCFTMGLLLAAAWLGRAVDWESKLRAWMRADAPWPTWLEVADLTNGPPSLQQTIRDCLQIDPQRRPQHAGELAAIWKSSLSEWESA
ncbi:sigma-70 family RNA polymerase sigma factor [Tuwongella immobilis]|uniref:Protein kinase domain-containing protein n=1 Tax=Tuwongella immobilis TaxID=692036 RepID=A0A6C2YP38_9BACT|nr:sigma-70 family RNA polymerase sigma factor [Tuwongella immobilis]VIP03388.1 serine threonine protein kinase : Serine/threonine protein kinase OS=Planctomyces maris DSM 8797 GN=PM8797T_04305 PE=4 SV=1: Sigma70_ECF: Pkinase [Tuwongella immobilis]VTS04148.1 serine threonine protein kinase : Serine/threonine protein kinase OS=Planctomyces maris DSM 8797 GN=PM8797T_04305 PE=4 SV=1: Sigma70_ECF: Pkinase [Tuwongella immobilis]